jgi:hypothetical protein
MPRHTSSSNATIVSQHVGEGSYYGDDDDDDDADGDDDCFVLAKASQDADDVRQ